MKYAPAPLSVPPNQSNGILLFTLLLCVTVFVQIAAYCVCTLASGIMLHRWLKLGDEERQHCVAAVRMVQRADDVRVLFRGRDLYGLDAGYDFVFI